MVADFETNKLTRFVRLPRRQLDVVLELLVTLPLHSSKYTLWNFVPVRLEFALCTCHRSLLRFSCRFTSPSNF